MSFDLKKKSYEELLAWSKPEIIIHCAAITDVDFCEKNPKVAYQANSELPSIVARACAEIKCKIQNEYTGKKNIVEFQSLALTNSTNFIKSYSNIYLTLYHLLLQ